MAIRQPTAARSCLTLVDLPLPDISPTLNFDVSGVTLLRFPLRLLQTGPCARFFFMLKTTQITLAGRDADQTVTLVEQPALVADRLARGILRKIGADPDGGVVAMALQHMPAVRALGRAGLELLQQFVRMEPPITVRDWHNIERLQQAALALHVGFIVDREALAIPVTMRAEQIIDGGPDVTATFCSPSIAAVLDSGKATYRELETVLSTEDCFNIVEILNIRAVRDWHAAQQNRT